MKIGTRGSNLALWQARYIVSLFEKIDPDIDLEIVVIVSDGDLNQTTPLTDFSTPGAFTSALDTALLNGDIDIAVHSMKDLPSRLADGIDILCSPKRADVRDVLVLGPNLEMKDGSIPGGTLIGTDSPRRRAQLLRANPGIRFASLRGNVETRVRKVMDGDVDACVLAFAGLTRLGLLDGLKHHVFDTLTVLPAPGQAAIAVLCRSLDEGLKDKYELAGDSETMTCVKQERKIMRLMNLGCSSPMAAYCEIQPDLRMWLNVRYFPKFPDDPDDMLDVSESGESDNPDELFSRVEKKVTGFMADSSQNS